MSDVSDGKCDYEETTIQRTFFFVAEIPASRETPRLIREVGIEWRLLAELGLVHYLPPHASSKLSVQYTTKTFFVLPAKAG